MKKIELLTVSPDTTILETLEVIDRGVVGIAMVVENDRKLIGTISDGDIRRALIKKASLSDPVKLFMSKEPIKARAGITNYELISIMKTKGIGQIPIVDEYGKLLEVKTFSEIITGEEKDNKLVIMAGGMGMRLRPLTHGTPKPLLPIGDKPILETIIEHGKVYGLRDIIISINYLSESIKNYFGDGSKFGVKISYIEEQEGLGTAGALGLIKEEIKSDLFVINGDILTRINFDEMLNAHKATQNYLTVATRHYRTQVPYGIIREYDSEVLNIEEKPVLEYTINAGIYILSPSIINNIPKNTCFHMTDLMQKLIEKKQRVGGFLIKDYWLDIGKINDYYKANIEFSEFFM